MSSTEGRQAGREVGTRPRSAREALGFSLEVVEHTTKIHAHYLEALERDDFEALPNRKWAQGFLVTYANRLGLEGEVLAEKSCRCGVNPARVLAEGPVFTLERGPQTLEGKEALIYLQGLDLPNNVRRAERQRDFLYAMFRQALSPRNLVSDPS